MSKADYIICCMSADALVHGVKQSPRSYRHEKYAGLE